MRVRLVNKVKIVFRVWAFLYQYQRYGILWGVALILAGLYPALTAWISKAVINSVFAPSREQFVSWLPNAFLFAILYGVVSLVHGIITTSSAVELVTISDKNKRVSDQLLMEKTANSIGITAYALPRTRDEIRLASIGGRSLPTCFTESVDLFQHLIAVLALSIILIHYHPLVAAIVLLPAIPLLYTQPKVRANTVAALIYESPLYRQMGYFLELMLGTNTAKEIRIYRTGPFFLEKYQQAADAIIKKARGLRWNATKSAMLWGLLAAAGIGGAYLYIIYLATTHAISIGDVVMYSAAVFYTGSSIRALIQSASSLSASIVSVEKFFDYLEQAPPVIATESMSASPALDSSEPEWVIDHVSYSYPEHKEKVLEDVSFSIRPKEKIAIVGLNGAGKTTLMKLMLRLLEPDEGTIRFRGTDLRAWNVLALRKNVGVVFQDFSKFKLTLYENIALALNGNSGSEQRDAAVLNAARLAGVDEIAARAPQGYQTHLGKEFAKGTDLSGGQWQRVALARGFVRDAGVVFLDEPTAALDVKTERALFERLMALAQNRTAIVISHRLFVTPMVDRILVLERGRLVEEGSHDQLMKQDGVYADMFKTQVGLYWPVAQ